LRGKIEFVRFTKDGEVDRRLINYQAGAPSGSRDNPFLMSGDIINVQESILSAASGLLNEFTGPFVGLYSVYSLFK
jgi:polysaccharide export outer membrane protein